jgi:hypothetical protein
MPPVKQLTFFVFAFIFSLFQLPIHSQMKPLMVSGNPAVGVPNGSDDGTASQPTNSTGCACIDGMIREIRSFSDKHQNSFFAFVDCKYPT